MNLNDAVMDEQNWKKNATILEKFLDHEVFFQLIDAPASLRDGKQVASQDFEMRVQFVTIESEPLAVFYTTKENRLLKPRIAGVPLHAAIGMVLRNATLNGLLLQSDKEEWVVVKKDALAVLSGLKGR